MLGNKRTWTRHDALFGIYLKHARDVAVVHGDIGSAWTVYDYGASAIIDYLAFEAIAQSAYHRNSDGNGSGHYNPCPVVGCRQCVVCALGSLDKRADVVAVGIMPNLQKCIE